MKIIFCILMLFQVVIAKEISVEYQSYDEALNGKNIIVFDMESTKAGIITTAFKGVVKSFKMNFDLTDKVIKNSELYFFVANMDTDNNSRNEKMHDLCFSSATFPDISVELGDIPYGVSTLNGKISLRGKEYPILVNVDVSRIQEKVIVKFKSEVSLKKLNIPDPSIFIASVRDLVELSGSVEIE